MNYDQLTRPYSPINRLLITLALLALALVLIVIAGIGPKALLKSAHELINAQTSKPIQQIIPATLDPNAVSLENRATEISHLLQRRWEDSLLAVEKVNIKDVTILEFHPDYSTQTLVLRGEALEFGALTDYIKQLNSTGLVKNIALMHEQAVSREHVDTIEFELRGEL